MNCPNCNETLVMSERQGVEIDYCPKCRGVWLDKGELDKIIEKSASYSADQPQQGSSYYESRRSSYPEQGKYNDPYYKNKKKIGYLGDLFDFD